MRGVLISLMDTSLYESQDSSSKHGWLWCIHWLDGMSNVLRCVCWLLTIARSRDCCMGILDNGRVLSESGTDTVFLEELVLVLVGEARLLVVPQPMELQWMLGWDGCDGKVLKKDSDFLGSVSEFNKWHAGLNQHLRINSQHAFNSLTAMVSYLRPIFCEPRKK
jgi:hypothetical protein